MRPRFPTNAALVAALTIAAAAPLGAQAGPRLGADRAGLRRLEVLAHDAGERPDLRVPRRTQWVKGGVIGATILGVGSFLLAAAMVGYGADGEPNAGDYLAPTLLGGVAGFAMGAVIGAQFAKD